MEMSVFQGIKLRHCTLGCKLNFAETASLANKLIELGAVQAATGAKADLCIVNTCCVTEVAVRKCRQAIRRLARQNGGAYIVVTGCFAQLSPDDVAAIEGVNLVLGNNEKARATELIAEGLALRKSNIAEELTSNKNVIAEDLTASKNVAVHAVKRLEIKDFAPACSRGDRTRYFLKVQDGCDYFCTYCAIPFARGRSRSPSVASLVRQAENAARDGAKEIVITGVNIGAYRSPAGEDFLTLVRALDRVDGIARYRISSLEPDLLSDDLIAFCAHDSQKFMPHFHIPLQSGSDEVLRLMHRRYDTRLFAEKIDLIKKLMPDAFIGIDVMAGCRGETAELFGECLRFVRSLPAAKLHVFPYSERPGTAALRIDYVVGEVEKRRRTEQLLALSEEKQHAFYASFIGKKRPVLFERSLRGGRMHGFTDNYLRVELPATKGLDNEIRAVRLTGFAADGQTLACELAD
ncbi:MAG: tRNA (N(6)-L-threonylcarbamoyladenosine(37)-C(2))-methylthiotransferase MtaB [Prevotella sp.]|nr:tRNA (N(6)-L-threonylcarbamoyladenosine(37)-C(2))-methylthiotransferase MtaB [Prevotella sp.]